MLSASYLSFLKERIKEMSDMLEDPAQIRDYGDYSFWAGKLRAFKECLEMIRESSE